MRFYYKDTSTSVHFNCIKAIFYLSAILKENLLKFLPAHEKIVERLPALDDKKVADHCYKRKAISLFIHSLLIPRSLALLNVLKDDI